MRKTKVFKNLATIPTVKSKAGGQHFAAGLGELSLLSNTDDKIGILNRKSD